MSRSNEALKRAEQSIKYSERCAKVYMETKTHEQRGVKVVYLPHRLAYRYYRIGKPGTPELTRSEAVEVSRKYIASGSGWE